MYYRRPYVEKKCGENKNVKDFTHEKNIANQTIAIFTPFDYSILQARRRVVARVRDKLFVVYNFQFRFQNSGFCSL